MAVANKLPACVLINGVKHTLVLIKIQSRYENGVPEDLTHLPDDMAVELVGGEQFLTAYIPTEMVKR